MYDLENRFVVKKSKIKNKFNFCFTIQVIAVNYCFAKIMKHEFSTEPSQAKNKRKKPGSYNKQAYLLETKVSLLYHKKIKLNTNLFYISADSKMPKDLRYLKIDFGPQFNNLNM
ncbi:hypothetical protein BpHYR1_041677 [Brachionus plicatilis]|uniref:Uncharacterized protein n=1 Tax=Brachionus plicatilis TaxID=10195 RepID=A0A3M7STG1_BRAPC|nr:hypothetical protein BpHYR1_041677 [Brachionus plicatilis]